MKVQKRHLILVALLAGATLLVAATAYSLFTPYERVSDDSKTTAVGTIISEADAIKAVRNLPEVSQWIALFNDAGGTSPKTGGKPVLAVDSTVDNSYFVHVYEDMPDHISTLGWYVVDMKTGEAFPYEDSPLFSKHGPCYGPPEGECGE
ncbi:MAG: hypothetical protein WC030_03780 [Candidatus Paceibacterota bacterium]